MLLNANYSNGREKKKRVMESTVCVETNPSWVDSPSDTLSESAWRVLMRVLDCFALWQTFEVSAENKFIRWFEAGCLLLTDTGTMGKRERV